LVAEFRKATLRQLDSGGAVLMHNHPSGDPTPSQAGVQMTKAIVDIAGRWASPCATTSSSARAGIRV
jgi:DNA repair protein RadC